MSAACHHAPVTSRTGPAVLATYSRSGFVEGHHLGHAVVVDRVGVVIRSWGDPDHVVFPRSSNKPAQAAGMVEAGLDLPERLLALAASSHSGEGFHLDGVREILAIAGVGVEALQTPADFPLDGQERDAWLRSGREQESLAMNCSGKHAAMLATCVVNGWPIETYREPGHPLQRRIRVTLERLADEPVAHVGVDGCGAPVMSLSLAGLARCLSQAVQAPEDSPEGRVARAMRAIPGLIAKDGAEGVYVAALPDGTGMAIKVEDGADRARQVALASILTGLGVPAARLEHLASLPMLGGGAIVGVVASAI
jgi:L-asparaginase II